MATYRYHLAQHIPAFYCKTFAGIARSHRVEVPKKSISYSTDYILSKTMYKKWLQLFKVSDASVVLPFTYASPYIVLRYCDVFKQLKISYRHVLHLRTEMRFLNTGVCVKPGEPFRVTVGLEDLAYTSGQRIAVVMGIKVQDQQGQCLLEGRDFLFANKVPQPAIDQLLASPQFNNKIYDNISKISKRTSQLYDTDANNVAFTLPKNMGKQYGVVSGDFNPIHTSRLLMHCFGVKNLFIQGMCGWNWVMKTLITEAGLSLSELNMTYCNPMFVGRTIQLLYKDHRFELVDSKGKLLAFGQYAAAHP
ncbi:MAG: MaoC/PaaZ C-terminal domain-containing protein [Coxiellaceae bacterium]|nr:MaoC/PaaZ C-terminal domain-containing protein [Coxiellaceae bacterium]